MSDNLQPAGGSNLALGTKISFLAAIPFLALALYFLAAPIVDVRTTTGAVFRCGSAIQPPSDSFQSGVCSTMSKNYLYRGVGSAIAGFGIAGAGFVLFSNRNESAPRAPRRSVFDDED
jgi:hypothetical protein